MPPPLSYSLLDCGGGRRLERFGAAVVARPAPAAPFPPSLGPERWAEADLSFSRENGWIGNPPPEWRVCLGTAVLNLRPAAQGQIGVFPEHAAAADRMEEILSCAPPVPGGRRVLNLFAHTGLATLRLAALSGAGETVHVDAAPAAIGLARENASASGLENAPIRWIRDDALAFVQRETRRERRYDAILADPPAYGRAKGGKEWKLERDLPDLLAACSGLLADGGTLCLTCHREGWADTDLIRLVGAALPKPGRIDSMRLALRPESGGAALAAGWAVFVSL